MTVGILNVSELKNKLHMFDQPANVVVALEISETWIKEGDKTLKYSLYDSEESLQAGNLKWDTGVGVVVSPLLPYILLSKYSSQIVQVTAMEMASTAVDVIYINPRA